MFTSLKKRLARNHQKAATRQLGLSAYYKYGTGLFFAVIYVFIFSVTALKNDVAITKSLITGQELAITELAAGEVAETKQSQPVTPEPAAKPYILDLPPRDISKSWYFEKGGFEHIVGLHKEMKAKMLAWEALTGKKILKQPFMQRNANETPKDDFNYYEYPDMAQSVRYSINEILDMRYKVNSTYEQHEAFCKQQTGRGEFSDAVRTCLNKPHTQAITEKGVCIYNNTPVYCGEHIRKYIKRVYYAATNENFFTAWPIFHHQHKFNNARIAYKLGLSPDTSTEDLAVADIFSGAGDTGNRFFKLQNNKVAKPQQITSDAPLIQRMKLADTNEVEALRVTVLFGACLVLFIYFIAGHKYAIIRPPKFIGKYFFLFSLPFFAFYIWSFSAYGGAVWPSALKAVMFFIPPMFLLTLPTYNMVFWEFIKEHPQYREWGILGKKGGSGRWGGIREFFKRDITDLLKKTQLNGVQKTDKSTLYLGKTNFKDDYQIGGRHIGLVSENHLIVNSASGGGKSLYTVTNMLAMWNGGGIIFDVKGEHWDTTASYRARFSDTHLLDPFGVIKSRDSDEWNPLAEIDPTKATAKADLQRLCSAVVFENSDTKKSDHFNEIGQQVITGFAAHVLTKFPEDKRHLGSVYDLFEMGCLKGEKPKQVPCKDAKGVVEHDSEGVIVTRDETHHEAIERILRDMGRNEAIGGAAREGASKMQRVGANERGSFYSTVSKSIAWVNDEAVRPIVTGRHDFSVRDAKTKESWCYLAMPESYLEQQMRFVRVFFQLASDLADNYKTERSQHHNRQTLFLFEEADLFGYFKTIEKICKFSRSSGIKAVLVVQNIGQVLQHYPNPQNILANCDKLFFGLAADDEEGLSLVSKALGGYKEQTNNAFAELNRNVAENHEIKELIDGEGVRQIFIPIQGKIIKIDRVPCYKNFAWSKH